MLWLSLALVFAVTRLVTGADDANDDKRTCGPYDKKKFNQNLLDLFRAEYGKEITTESDTRKILNWKFESLDRNDDDFLQRPEYKPLKRLKRLVKPKKCAKTFTRACDRDRDSRISKEEWSNCLGVDVQSLRSSSVVALSEHKKKKEEPEANDCTSDRQTVLSEQRPSASEMYVPECTPDGRYRLVQCYKSTGYCWCVNQDDGKPIPGTSVKDQAPDCDSLPTPARPMKGCPWDKKEAFLQSWRQFLDGLSMMDLCMSLPHEQSSSLSLTDDIPEIFNPARLVQASIATTTVKTKILLRKKMIKLPTIGHVVARGSVHLGEWANLCDKSDPTNDNRLNITFIVPGNLSMTEETRVCVMVTGHRGLVPLSHPSSLCLPEEFVPVNISKIAVLNGYGDHFASVQSTDCKNGTRLHVLYGTHLNGTHFLLSKHERGHVAFNLEMAMGLLLVGFIAVIGFKILKSRKRRLTSNCHLMRPAYRAIPQTP